MNQNEIISQSKSDIDHDQNEFTWLLKDILRRNSSPTISESIDHEIKKAKNLKKTKITVDFLEKYSGIKFDQIKSTRSLAIQSGAFSIANEWQSPSFCHTNQKMNGELSGKISHTINDYKRDHHKIEFEYERKFTHQFLPNNFQFLSLATNSGMAAFTTVNHYVSHIKNHHTVLMGKRSYFEIKKIIKQTYEHVIEFDENDLGSINPNDIIKSQSVFIDSISNDQSASYASLEEISTRLLAINKSLLFVIDNTVPSFSCDVFSKIKSKNAISYESLNKHHQYGMDMVTGGIIYARQEIIKIIRDARMHLGTNISDFNALTLPTPNKKLLLSRMDTITKNSKIIHSNFSPNQIYPLKIHAIQPFITFQFTNIKQMKKFTENVYKKSKRENVEITGGTSFGLSTSRLYLTALHSDEDTHPFVRFSPGTETRYHMQKIANILLTEYAKLQK